MDVLTLYVGQGALGIVRHGGEAVIVDSHLPDISTETLQYIEGKLETAARGHIVRGLVLTGLDADHSHVEGVDLILTRLTPDWVMYPKCYKDTDCATSVFRVIDKHVKRREGTARPFRRVSVCLDKLDSRILFGLATNFSFELFSPHTDDMNTSNNSSIVMRLTGLGSGGFSYLITGDTEHERWETINRYFGNSLQSNVIAAPHHGSKTGANAQTIVLVAPNTVLISAGHENQYGHPNSQAVEAYQRVAKQVYSTHVDGGVSLFTRYNGVDFETLLAR